MGATTLNKLNIAEQKMLGYTFNYKWLFNFKIVNDLIIFVRGEGTEAEHTWAYVSISLSEASCKKN